MPKLLILLLCALCSGLVSGAPELRKGSQVKVQVLYECMCPGCKGDITEKVVPVFHQLSDYMDLQFYPYGNARTQNKNGTVVVQCQHGEGECYGNKIHACAIDILKNVSVYADYIACMMKDDSTDEVATECGNEQKIDAVPILKCAKGDQGQQLLIKTGTESKKIADYKYVPYIVLNGQCMDFSKDLKTEICKLINPAPPACSN